MKRQKTGKIFYGWYIVLAGMVIFSAIMGIIGNCISLFLVPVCRDLGFSRKAMGANQTIIFGCTALFSFFAGKFFETFNSKRVLQVCGILAGVAYFSYSFATKLWQFYLLSTLCGFCFAAMTIVPMSMIINNWFHQKSGVALGISFMGSGVGGMVFNFIAGGCMEAFGWRAAYRILAGLMLLLVLPCVFRVIYVHPEEIGLLPYGEKSAETAAAATLTGLTLKEALCRPYFWIHCICYTVFGFTNNTVATTIAPHLNDIGAPAVFCTAAIACSMGMLAVGKFAVGKMLDRLSPRCIFCFAYGAVCMGLLSLILAKKSLLFIFPIVLGMGFGCPFGTLGGAYLTRTFFGQRDYVTIVGIFSALGYLGGMLSPLLNGAVFDALGSYEPTLWVQMLLSVFSLLLCCFAATRKSQVSAQA